MRSARKILRCAAIVLGVLVALLVLVSLLAPKIVNVDAVRAAIERTVSRDLGGAVSFGQVDLSLFPHPEIGIRDVTIEIPGSVSVSGAAVSFSARLLPLLRGRFAVESATLDHPALVFTVPSSAAKDRKPAGSSLGHVLTVSNRAAPGLSLKISRGSLSLVRDGRTALSLGELEARLALAPAQQEGQGTPGGASAARFHITGEAQGVIGRSGSLPGPLRISTGRFDAVPENLAIAGFRAQLLDMEVTLDGSVGDYLSGAPRADIAAGGSIGADAAAWLGTLAGLPDDLKLRAPIKVATARLRTSGTGPASSRELTGSVVMRDGLTIPFEVRQEPGLLSLERLQLKDGASDALLTGSARENVADLAFTGSLGGSTLLRIFDRERMPFGSIKGDIRVRVPRRRWRETTAEGTLEGRELVLSSRLAGALAVDRFSIRASGRTLLLEAARVALDRYVADGVALTLSLSEGRTAVDLERALICGISVAGSLRIDDREIEITLQPQARGRRLEEDLRCLFHWDVAPSGTYDLAGSMSARGSRDTLLRSLQGTFDVSAKKGRINNARVVEGVIAYLETTSALKGSQAADLRKGIPYQSITLRGALRDGVVNLAKCAIRSKAVQVAAEGGVDLRGRTLDLQVLVAPFTGLDQVLSKVPVVRHIVGNAFLVVPVRVVGPFDKPEVRHLPASGVGTSVANLMKNIVQAPVKIIEPIVPAGGGKAP